MSLRLCFLLALCWAVQAVPKCNLIRPTMMTCLEATAEDLPKTKQDKAEWLVLTRCTIPTLKKTYLDNFPALTDFHAENAKIESLESNVFKNQKLLDWVDLSQNKLTNIPVDVFAENPKLYHVNISSNSLIIPDNRPFLNSPKLKWLDLQKSHIAKLYDATFRNLPNLEVLSLSHNELETLPVEVFKHQTKLNSLRLDGNKFRTLSYDVVKNLKTLVVYLADNPWSCDCTLYPTIQWTKRNLVKDDVRCVKPDTKPWKQITTMQCEPIK